jgi:hypothetical protein
MSVFHQRLARTTSIALVLIAGILPMRLSAAEDQPSGAVQQPVITTALSPVSKPTQPDVPVRSTIRAPASLERGTAAPGVDPDPETFDREGLETWWRHYQTHTKAAE